MSRHDELASELADAINKNNKTGVSAFFLDDPDVPTNVSDWISTGNTILDIAISNRPHGGIPVGRIVELNGLEQSGKSLLAAHILAETQKKGGLAVLLDTENAVSTEFFQAIGLDISKLLYVQPDCVEEIFEVIETIIEKVRKSSKDKHVTIVVDSVAQSPTKSEINGDFDKAGYNTDKSIVLGQAMRKITNMIGEQKISIIFTNQLRMKLNAMPFGDPYITPGGKALPYACSVIIRLSKIAQIKEGDRIIGVKVRAELKKNRVGPPFTKAEFEIYFESGIDNYGSWLKTMKDNKLVKSGGAWYTYVEEGTGEEHKFQAKDFHDLVENNEDLKEEIYRKICEATILQYKGKPDIDSIVIEEDDGTEI